MRRAKIVCTLGPAVDSADSIRRLVDAGMDVARLNMSHGSHDDHRRLYDLVRQASDATGHGVGIIADLQGPKIRLETFTGGKAKLAVPEGTQPNAAFRIKGHGVPHLGARGRGDLHVVVRVVVPTKLNKDQRRLMEELAKTLPVPELNPKDKSFIDKMKDILS